MTMTSQTSLTAATQNVRARLREQLGPLLDEFDARAEAQTAGAGAREVGDIAPSFTLPDARGGMVALEALLPAVLVFYRGAWCPYCNLQLAAFRAAHADLGAAGASLAAISPQTPDASLSLAERAELEFPVLSDAGNAVARAYGLVFQLDDAAIELHRRAGVDVPAHNGDDSWELPVSSVFAVDAGGTIRYRSVAADHRWRVGPDEVLAALSGT
jgi:peroxiredoxin